VLGKKALIANKIWFLNHHLARLNTAAELAATSASCGDRSRFLFFKGRVFQALKSTERLLRDSRIPLPQEEADRLTANYLMGILRYRALKLSNITSDCKVPS